MNSVLSIILIVFAIGVSVNAKYIPGEDIDLLLIGSDELGKGPTPEQQQCINDSIKKLVEDNPQLNWWWEEIGKSSAKINEAAKKCQELPNEQDQKKCLAGVKRAARKEIVRLIKLLPPEDRPILGKIKQAIVDCLKNNN